MANIIQKTEAGTPKLTMTWRKGAVIQSRVDKNAKGRYVCMIKVDDGEFFALPSSHPNEKSALATIEAYIAENTHKGT